MPEKKLIYCFDFDETICFRNSGEDYTKAFPISGVVEHINKLYDDGHRILIFTARGASSGRYWLNVTYNQCLEWGLKFHSINPRKPSYDIIIDDKAINAEDFRKSINAEVKGFVASSFDLLHAGHCLFLREARQNCDYLIAALQNDPTIEDFMNRPLKRPKNKPIQSLKERRIQLESCKYIDEILEYNTEKDLENILKKIKPSVRFLGSDYEGIKATGEEFCERIFYHKRDHEYSSTSLRKKINDNK
jgi:glycerol-3-phosphate cytidylyltransferase